MFSNFYLPFHQLMRGLLISTSPNLIVDLFITPFSLCQCLLLIFEVIFITGTDSYDFYVF